MKMPKSKYEQTKVCDETLVKEMTSVQDIFSIVSIEESGIFELNNKRFSKLYVLSDINFAGVTDDEQKQLIINFSNVLKSMPCRFSYSVANKSKLNTRRHRIITEMIDNPNITTDEYWLLDDFRLILGNKVGNKAGNKSIVVKLNQVVEYSFLNGLYYMKINLLVNC